MSNRVLSNGFKVCARCGRSKPLDAFYHYKGRPISYCRPCNAAYHQEHKQHKAPKQSPKTAELGKLSASIPVPAGYDKPSWARPGHAPRR